MKKDDFVTFWKNFYLFAPYPAPLRLTPISLQSRGVIFGFLSIILSSCGGQGDPDPNPIAENSYEFRFADGPLAGREFKASALNEEQAMALYAAQPGTDMQGISIQLNTNEVTVAAAISLNSNSQPLPLKPDSDESGSRLAISIRDGNSTHVYSGQSGPLTIKNFIKKSGGNAASGLATLELEFENAVFIDAVAAGNNEHSEVKLSGKIKIK